MAASHDGVRTFRKTEAKRSVSTKPAAAHLASYNGLYGLLPRQYIAAELFERVEVMRGASAFLNGASPNSDGIGGTISLLPKRAANEPLNSVTAGWSSGNQTLLSADFSRRFGTGNSTGGRVNVARREGGTGIDNEHVELSLFSLGLDWRGEKTRLSADIGYQDNKLRQTRTNAPSRPPI